MPARYADGEIQSPISRPHQLPTWLYSSSGAAQHSDRNTTYAGAWGPKGRQSVLSTDGKCHERLADGARPKVNNGPTIGLCGTGNSGVMKKTQRRRRRLSEYGTVPCPSIHEL